MKFPFKTFILVIILANLITACTSRIYQSPTQLLSPTNTPGSLPPATSLSPTEKELPNTLLYSTPQVTQTVSLPVYAAPYNTQQATQTDSIPFNTPQSNPAALTQYRLSVLLTYGNHHLSVEEQIVYTNQTPDSLTEFILIVEPTRYPSVFHLKSMHWEDGTPIKDYTLDIGWLRLPLLEALSPGEELSLSISYDLDLPSPDASYYGRPVPFGYTSRQTNLVDWYPFLPPYLPGYGWLIHQAGFFGEYLVYDTADFQVDIQISDQRGDLILAASAPDQAEGQWHHYLLKTARNFVWSVSPLYQVERLQVGDVTLLGYAFPAHAAAGFSALRTSAEALTLYSHLLGPYPHDTLSVVEADFLDGMEYDGLYFLSNGFYNLYAGSPSDYLTAIAAHETAHQWWYGLVGNDQALEPWLDEAMCTYMERLFYEHLHPESLDWWWTYRVNYYQPQGWVDGSIYNPEGYRAYRDAVYLNGALFLEDLRRLIGDDTFFQFLKDYLVQYSHKIATKSDFFRVLQTHTSKDLNPLIEKYFSNK